MQLVLFVCYAKICKQVATLIEQFRNLISGIERKKNSCLLNLIKWTFAHKHTQALKDWYLAVGVFLLVFVDLIILLTYNIVEGVQGNLTAVRVPNRENVMDVNGVGWFTISNELQSSSSFHSSVCMHLNLHAANFSIPHLPTSPAQLHNLFLPHHSPGT